MSVEDNKSQTFEVMSTSEMLDYCITYHRPYCQVYNMFIHGHLPIFNKEKKYVYVDLEQDKVNFLVDDIKISVDIDSIIWTTRKPVWKHSIGVYLTSIYDSKLGIPKYNYIYVNILIS